MSVTRQALRQQIGRLTGDMLKCTATANGGTGTYFDSINLYRGDGRLSGRIGWFAAGTSANLYSVIRVTNNTRSDQSIAFTPNVASNTATGDVLELWNENGEGYLPADVNDEINVAIQTMGGGVLSYDEDASQTFDFDDPYLDIPADWDYFSGAYYQDINDVWHEIPITPYQVDVDPNNRVIRLKGQIARLADNNLVRLTGQIAASTLTSDTQSTDVDAEWLTAYVAYKLMFAGMRRTSGNDDERSTRMAFAKQISDQARGRARNRPAGAAIRLP